MKKVKDQPIVEQPTETRQVVTEVVDGTITVKQGSTETKITVPAIGEKESKSAYIRRLTRAGFTVNQISHGTGIRYQMVRNIVKAMEDSELLAQVKSEQEGDKE